MTRRERLEAKLDKRQEWAGKAQTRSTDRYNAAGAIADRIPLGQPILVGHHSEVHARADQSRIESNMAKSIEEMHLAAHHTEKATGIERMLKHDIFSDDADAIEALQSRIAQRETKAAAMVAMNAAWRKSKGNVATFATLANIAPERAQAIANGIEKAYSWEKQPIPAYELSNLRATIRTDQKRLEQIRARNTRTEKAEQAGGVVVQDAGSGYVRVTFAEKPSHEVLGALKTAGFFWNSGSWAGKRDQLPECIT